MALRALVLSEQFPIHPAHAALQIQFVDARTRTPMAGVQVTGSGAGRFSAPSGRLHMRGLAPGAYTLSAVAPGYSSLQISASLQRGQSTDLGVVQMLLTANSATTTIINGTVRDNDSGEPISGASITVAGHALTTSTDAQGRYLISDVPPGALTLRAGKAGYFDASGQASVLAGQTLNFSPRLVHKAGGSSAATAGCRIMGRITWAADDSPVAGASVALSGANTGSATSDAGGAYALTGLVSGQTRIAVSQSGFDAAVANTRLNCSPQSDTALQYSPKLYASQQSPSGVNGASLSGIVLDARSNQPIAAAQLRFTIDTGIERHVQSQADGRFAVGDLDGATAQLLIAAAGYQGITVSYALQPAQHIDLGQLRLRPPKVTQLTLDLQVQAVERHSAQTDPQTLRVSGALRLQLRNAGTLAAPANVAVLAFVDGNANGAYDQSSDPVLGQARLSAALEAGQSQTMTIEVAGLLPFRDAPIHVLLDPSGALAESDKANNIRSSAQDVLYTPQAGTFAPKLKWRWRGRDDVARRRAYPRYQRRRPYRRARYAANRIRRIPGELFFSIGHLRSRR